MIPGGAPPYVARENVPPVLEIFERTAGARTSSSCVERPRLIDVSAAASRQRPCAEGRAIVAGRRRARRRRAARASERRVRRDADAPSARARARAPLRRQPAALAISGSPMRLARFSLSLSLSLSRSCAATVTRRLRARRQSHGRRAGVRTRARARCSVTRSARERARAARRSARPYERRRPMAREARTDEALCRTPPPRPRPRRQRCSSVATPLLAARDARRSVVDVDRALVAVGDAALAPSPCHGARARRACALDARRRQRRRRRPRSLLAPSPLDAIEVRRSAARPARRRTRTSPQLTPYGAARWSARSAAAR